MGSVDWQMNKTLWQCTKHMLENEIDYDVNFRIGEDPENIKAHKLILRLRSPVFDRMFNGAYQESEKDPVVPDVTPAAFQALLRYCYYDCLDIEDDVALSVLYAANKYMLPLLEKAAREKLIQVMGASNIWDIYKYALSVGDTELDKRCQTYFQGSVTPVRDALQAEAFLNIPHKVLLKFLHINDKVPCQKDLGISVSDINIFKACNAWAEAECLRQEIDPTGTNKRTVLGECLFMIRFPTMLFKDLVNIVYPTGILTHKEKDDLCQYNHKEAGSKCKIHFPSKKRQFVVKKGAHSFRCCYDDLVLIESDVRLMFSRIWMQRSGSYRVTVKNEISSRCWSMRCDTKHQNHCTRYIANTRIPLCILDIEPHLLEPYTKYSVRVEVMGRGDSPDTRQIEQWAVVGKVSPYKEVKISWDTELRSDNIFALTLQLV